MNGQVLEGTLLSLSPDDAKVYCMRPGSYCSLDLPSYIDFSEVLSVAQAIVGSGTNYRLGNPKPGSLEGINYRLIANKDGSYAWRPFQLVHPVLYVELVNIMTEPTKWKLIQDRFSSFQKFPEISCCSLPILAPESKDKEKGILNWWQRIEQESVRLSLEFEYLALTDITDCYGALYTHSVAWALHGRVAAKANRNCKTKGGVQGLFGNCIDDAIQDMQNRQTNGIPQGNLVSDLIAEMVLGYADELLHERLVKDGLNDSIRVLRYRDDYRIFAHTERDARQALLILSDVLAGLNFKLNNTKTRVTDDVIGGSIKSDKIYWNSQIQSRTGLFKTLLLIRDLSLEYPGSGSLSRALGDFRQEIGKLRKAPRDIDVLVAVIVDIMHKNPRVYPTAASILSKFFSLAEDKRDSYVRLIRDRFVDVPNVSFLDIWLQRIMLGSSSDVQYDEKICKIVDGDAQALWNSEWLVNTKRSEFNKASIVDDAKLRAIGPVISVEETEIFLDHFVY